MGARIRKGRLFLKGVISEYAIVVGDAAEDDKACHMICVGTDVMGADREDVRNAQC